jgi:hypothetical protein
MLTAADPDGRSARYLRHGRALWEVLQVDDVTSNDATSRMPGGYYPNFFHWPSETTSTEPSTTLMAVCSSMA